MKDESLPPPINKDDIASLQADPECLLKQTHDIHMPWASKPFCDKLFSTTRNLCDRIMNEENDDFHPGHGIFNF